MAEKFNPAEFARQHLKAVCADMAVEAAGSGIAAQKAREKLLELSGYSALEGQEGQVYEVQIVPIAFIRPQYTQVIELLKLLRGALDPANHAKEIEAIDADIERMEAEPGEITACPHLIPEVHYKATPKPKPQPQPLRESECTPLYKKSSSSPAQSASSSSQQDADMGKPIAS